tara:strand:+ start:396 stop:686 length:291 start_codon:yes stop_codon:yes gene_type:complete
MWKVYRIDDGEIFKAGFTDDETAEAWLLSKSHLAREDYEIEEMDEDEAEEWQELEEKRALESAEEDESDSDSIDHVADDGFDTIGLDDLQEEEGES